MIHIDKYNIFSYGKEYKNGKESKTSTIQQTLTSKQCINGKQFLNLLSDLDEAWHQHEGKDVHIEVNFVDIER